MSDKPWQTYLGHERELQLKLARKSNYEDVTLEAVFHEWDVYTDANGDPVEKNESSGPAAGASVAFAIENPKGPLSDPETHTDFEGKASTFYQVWASETLTTTVHFQDLVETISLVVQSDGSWAEKSELKTSLSLSGDTLTANVTEETWMERFNTKFKATQKSNLVSQPAAYASLGWSVETGNATLLTADATADETGTGKAKLKLGSAVSSIRASGQFNYKISPPSAPVPVPARDPADVQQPIIQCRWAKASTHGGHHDYTQGAWVYKEGHIEGVGGTGSDSDWELCPGYDYNSAFATRATAPQDYKGWIRENWPLETVGGYSNSDGILGTVSSPSAARLALDVSELDWLDGLSETTVTSTTFVGAYGLGTNPIFQGKPNYTPDSVVKSVVIIGSQGGIKADFTGGTLQVRIARPASGDNTDPLGASFWLTTISTSPDGVTTTSTTTDDLVILAGAPYSTRNILLAANVTVNGSAITKMIGTVAPPDPTVKIEPDTGMSGVIGDIVKSTKADSKIQHFVTPKEAGQFVILKATGITQEQIKDGDPKQIYEWDTVVGQAVPNEPLKWKVSRSAADRFEVKIKRKSDATVASQMDVWVVWAETSVKDVGPVVDSKAFPGGIGINLSVKVNFEYDIMPKSILDLTSDVPDLNGPPGNPPGVATNSCGNLLKGGVKGMWDATRSIEVKSTDSVCQDKTRPFPNDPLEGNDDAVDTDEVLLPYKDKKLSQSDHAQRVMIGPFVDLYDTRLRFYEFVRLEIGGKWFLISSKYPWRVHFKMKRVNGVWLDENSASDQLDQPFQ